MFPSFRKGWLLLALSGCTVAAAQGGVPAQQSRQDPVRVTAFPKGVFRLSTGKLTASVDLREQLSGCWSGTYDGSDQGSRPSGGEADTRVVDLVRRGGSWYLTFQATLNSRCNVQGECGAGSDISLVWLKLTPALRVVAKQVEPIELCMSGLSVTRYTGFKNADERYMGGPLVELRLGQMNVVSSLSDYDKKMDTLITVRYRHAAPERGLLVSSKTVVQK